MPFTRIYRSSTPRYRSAAVAFQDFSGGLNLRDAPPELADNQTPLALNVTLDEQGGVVKRLGYTRLNASPMAGIAQQMFWWDEKGLMIIQIGTGVYKTSDFTTFTSIKTYSTTERAAFASFIGKLVAVHPTDRVSTYDGTTWTDIGAGSPKGSTIAVWQNKVWVADGVSTTVTFSAAGSVATFPATVDIREGSDAPVTALGAGQGMDISGRGGLLAFKEKFIHRINDSTTGAYTTITNEAGASNHNAVVGALGVVVAMSKRGIVMLDENDQPKIVSEKIEPLFRDTQINFTKTALFTGGYFRNRVFFSFPYGAAQTTNNRTLEFIPATGAFVIHTLGAAAFATYRSGTERLYAAEPGAAYVDWFFKSGSDNGVAIASQWQSKWFEVMAQGSARFRQAFIDMRGAFTFYPKFDYTLGLGDSYNLSIASNAAVWGVGVWGVGVWGPGNTEDTALIYDLGVGRAVSFYVSETSSTSSSAPNLLGDGAGDEIGAWALYGIRTDFSPLGLS